MKKTLLFIFLASAMLYSCSKGGSGNTIIGKWYLAADTIYYYNSGVQFQQTIYSDYNRHFYYQYNSDGTGLEKIDTVAGQLNFTYKLSGHSLALTFQAQDYNGQSYYAGTTNNTITLFTSTRLGYNYTLTNGDESQTHHLLFSR